ncbi:MAG: LemA family protein [Ferruginibacter sp.]
MKRTGLFIFLGIVVIIFFWGCSGYNGLATASTSIDGKWGEVQAQYNRKAKLYENVVNTIKGAARNEDTTLIKIVQMRSKIPNTAPANPQDLVAADKQLNAVGQAALNINVEAYPTLKATDLYRDLQAQIEGTENRVTVALGDWNNAITAYNTKLVRFPTNILAGLFGYKKKDNYVAPVGSEDTKVDFNK